jgi:hypothetical protein
MRGSYSRSCIGGFSFSIAYGLPVRRQDDPRVRFAGLVFEDSVAAIGPGRLLINFVSSLCQDIPEWMPGAGFKKAAHRLRLRIVRLVEEPCQALLVSLCFLTLRRDELNLERHIASGGGGGVLCRCTP